MRLQNVATHWKIQLYVNVNDIMLGFFSMYMHKIYLNVHGNVLMLQMQ